MTSTRDPAKRAALAEEFAAVINRLSAENGSDTPDFILGQYLVGCLETFEQATGARDKWHGFRGADSPTNDGTATPPNPGAAPESADGTATPLNPG